MTEGMIQAAGQGSRVRPLTNDVPKLLIPILGKPVMECLVALLAAHAPWRKACVIGSPLFPLLAVVGLFFFVQSRLFRWIDLGGVTDYRSVLQRALTGTLANVPMPCCEVRPAVFVGFHCVQVDGDTVDLQGLVYLSASVQFESGCTVRGPAWIGQGNHLRTGVSLERCVLMEYTRIGAGVTTVDMVASPRFCVDRQGKTTCRGDDTAHLHWSDARACYSLST